MERSTYTKYESGDTELSIATLIRLRHILGVSYEELLEVPLSEKEIAYYHDAHYMRKE